MSGLDAIACCVVSPCALPALLLLEQHAKQECIGPRASSHPPAAPSPACLTSPACLRAGEGPLAGAVTQHDAVQLSDVQLVALGPGVQGHRGSCDGVLCPSVPYLLLAGGTHAHITPS
jgi:hypothetical protein